MNHLLQKAGSVLARLNSREQRLVSIFGSLLAVVMVWKLIVSPALSGREHLARDIDSLKIQIVKLNEMSTSIAALSKQKPRKGERKPDPNFSLLAFLDRVSSSNLAPESIDAMTPARRRIDAESDESTVELKISSASLGEVVSVLEDIEASANPVFVKLLDLRKRYDDDSRFDVSLVVATVTHS